MALKFDKNTIHRENEDFIRVNHLRISGSNEEIGYALGLEARNVHAISRTVNSDTLKNKCQKQYLQKNYPIHYQRMKGLASAYSENIDDTNYDFSCFGNPMNAMGCSAVFYPPEFTEKESGILSRNLDLPLISFSEMISGKDKEGVSMIANMYVIEIYPDKGYASLINLSFELFGLALDGINSEGLTVTHLYADTVNKNTYMPTKEYGVGVNEMLVVQMLLDNCKTTEEAKELLLSNKHFYMLLPTHLLVADRHGKSFVWEYSPQHNREYIIDGNSEIQIVTNFLLHEFNNSGIFPASKERICPFSRYKSIENAVKKNSMFSNQTIKKINSQVFITDDMFETKPLAKERTIYHCLFDTGAKSMEISFYRKDEGGKQYRTKYFEFQLM